MPGSKCSGPYRVTLYIENLIKLQDLGLTPFQNFFGER